MPRLLQVFVWLMLATLLPQPAEATLPFQPAAPPPACDGVYLNPTTGRFWSMDSFEGNASEPLSLHKYLYAHANPVNNTDPSGHYTVTEIQSVVGQGLSLMTRLYRGYSGVKNAFDTVHTFLEIGQFLQSGGLSQVISQSKAQVASWGTIPSGSSTAKLLDSDFWDEAFDALSMNSSRIVSGVSRGSGKLIAERLLKLGKKNFEWVIYMPTPSDETPLDRLIPSPSGDIPIPGVELAGASVHLAFGGGGGSHRGRVFGLGIQNKWGAQQRTQFFRMDYHNAHGRNANDVDYFSVKPGKHPFHVHTRNN